MTSFFTKKIHLIDASTQTENVYGLQPIETKIDEIKTELSSLTKNVSCMSTHFPGCL